MSLSRPRVAVTGASGWVGAAVAAELEGIGADVVRVVGRRPRADATRVDLALPSSADALRRAFEGCETVIHAAAHVHAAERTQQDRDQFHAVNVDGTARVVEAAEHAGSRRIVFVSTIGVHGFEDGRVRHEEDLPAPSGAYGATKWLGEQIVRASKMDGRIARLATLVGRGDHANYARLARAIAKRRFVVPGDGSAKKSMLAIEDAARLLARTALVDSLPYALFHLAHPHPLALRAIVDVLADALGVRRPPNVPLGALLPATKAIDQLGRIAGVRTELESTLGKLTTDAVVSTDRAETNFPAHAYRSLEDVAAAYRTNVIQAEAGS